MQNGGSSSQGPFSLLSSDNQAVKMSFTASAVAGQVISYPYNGTLPNNVKVLLDETYEVPLSATDGYLYAIAGGRIYIRCGSKTIGSTFTLTTGKISEKITGQYQVTIY